MGTTDFGTAFWRENACYFTSFKLSFSFFFLNKYFIQTFLFLHASMYDVSVTKMVLNYNLLACSTLGLHCLHKTHQRFDFTSYTLVAQYPRDRSLFLSVCYSAKHCAFHLFLTWNPSSIIQKAQITDLKGFFK